MYSRIVCFVVIAFTCFGTELYPRQGARAGEEDDRTATLQWIRSLGGEYDVDETQRGNPVIAVRLDRTRGIDPGFTMDQLNPNDLARLVHLPGLRRLTLEYRPKMTDEALVHIGKLESLEELNLDRTPITGSGFSALVPLKKLKRLSLRRCSRLDYSQLKSLTQLKELLLEGNRDRGMSIELWAAHYRTEEKYPRSLKSSIQFLDNNRGGLEDKHAKQLKDLVNLELLSLPFTKISGEGLKSFEHMTKLRQLDLSYTAVDDDGLQHLSPLKDLRSISLNCTGISNAGLKHFLAFPELEYLSLNATGVNGARIAVLKDLKNLKVLELRFCPITDDGVLALAAHEKLNSIQLERSNVTLKGILALAERSPQMDLGDVLLNAHFASPVTGKAPRGIYQINLTGQKFDVDELAFVKDFPDVNSLGLGRTNVTDDGLVHLKGLTNLRSLSLNHTEITDEGLKNLTRLRELGYLNLSDTAVTSFGLIQLVPLSKLKRVVVDNTSVSLGAILSLLTRHGHSVDDVLKAMGCIKTVSTRNGQKAPVDYVRIDLRSRFCTDWDLDSLMKATPFDALFLDNGGEITSKGIAQIGEMKHLSALWFNGIPLGVDELKVLSRMPKLEILWLTDAALKADGLQQLEDFPALESLNLCGNALGEAELLSLRNLKMLKTLIIDVSSVSNAAIVRFQADRPDVSLYASQHEPIQKLRGNTEDRWRRPVHVKLNGPDDLVRLMGKEYFEQAERVTDYPRMPKSALPQLRFLKSTLESASFTSPEDGPMFIEEISQTKIKSLSLYRAHVADGDLEPLKKLTSLEELNLERTQVTDACLATVKLLPNLNHLELGGYQTQIGNGGMVHLRDMKKLERLGLNRTNITDAALEMVGDVTTLKSLALREAKISEGLKHLQGLNKLETLDLTSSAINDDAIQYLAKIGSLKRLNLYSTSISQESVQWLKKALPMTKISYSPRKPK